MFLKGGINSLARLLNNKTWKGTISIKKNSDITPTFIFNNSICQTNYFKQKYRVKNSDPWDTFIYRIEYKNKYYACLVLYLNANDTTQRPNPYAIFKVNSKVEKEGRKTKFVLRFENGQEVSDPMLYNSMTNK